MKILIFGVGGMAGHVIYNYFHENEGYEVWGTARENIDWNNVVYLNVLNVPRVVSLIEHIQPDVIINAIGLLNEHAAQHQKEAIYVNALFPHVLADIGQRIGCKLIHISTDCVFSGRTGSYRETDETDGLSVYARTKSLGEVIDTQNLTIRTSIIGPERKSTGIGLFHWFCQQKGQIRGYRKVYWNGVTTLELAKAIEWILGNHITGLVHLTAPSKVSKYELLLLIKKTFDLDDVKIVPVDQPESDKTLFNTRDDFSYKVQCYPSMIQEMKDWMSRKGT